MSSLMEYLEKIRENRGIMADLRCALADSKKHRAYPYLGYLKGIGEDFKARSVQVLAGLYATHPPKSDKPVEGNMGTVCYKMLSDDERKDYSKNPDPVSKRFQHLLAAKEEEIFDRLIRLVNYAKSKEIPVNYPQIEQDLKDWEYQSERVKTRWAKSFWAPNVKEEED
ncbi:MAG TPA: type I-E CRISPR-associated protein Cse2/CasB [Spirochaetia bacterium]|nr:type I-E CRISPR-associated protein Cse2/CasB [Spirochaetia bacterium]